VTDARAGALCESERHDSADLIVGVWIGHAVLVKIRHAAERRATHEAPLGVCWDQDRL